MPATHGKKAAVYKWNGSALNLVAEACTESGAQAQITDASKRLLNPHADITFTDSGGANLIRIDHVDGIGYFDANVTAVTVAGTGAYIPAANLIKTGYLFEWSFDLEVDTAETTAFQSEWKTYMAGAVGGAGSAGGYFAGANWWDDVEDIADATKKAFLLQLFSYDPDDDQSGDHYTLWAIFNKFGLPPSVGDVVKETIGFQVLGKPRFDVNV